MRKRKSPLQKAKENPQSTYWRNKADAAWSATIRRHYKGRCAYCGEPGRDTHHLVDRDVFVLRHETLNGILLCYQHHRGNARVSAHRGSVGFLAWFMQHWPDRWEYLVAHYMYRDVPDYQAAVERLKRESV